MSGPQEMHIIFRHQGDEYNIDLVKGKLSDHSVKINGVIYAVQGDKEKLNAACEILISVSLEAITSEKDLQGRLFFPENIASQQSQKTEGIGIEIFQDQISFVEKPKTILEAYVTLAEDLKSFSKEKLKEGALLVQVIGIKEAEPPLVFGRRSVNDVNTVKVNEVTIGRTGSGAKLWAGLLTNILTSKYWQYIQMKDGLGKFAPQEALNKFGRIGQDGKDLTDTQRAKEISVEGLIGMMAGLEYEQPSPKNPPQSTLDQFLRGSEIKDGAIHILYHPGDKINLYTNNICFVAYPIEKAYKKVLAAKLIEQGKLNENETLSDLSPKLDEFRSDLKEKIKKTEEEIDQMRQIGNSDVAIEPFEIRLAYQKAELQKLSIPDSAPNISLKDLMDCKSAYTESSDSVYIYDSIDLYLMATNNHQVDYAEIMKRELLGPMGMDNSGFNDVPGTHMDVTFENDKTKQDESYTPGIDHPMRFGAGFGKTSLSDASKLASGLADSRGLVGKDNESILLTREELDDFFTPHGHYAGWGLGGAELTCEGKIIDKGGSLGKDQYSFWVDRDSGVGMIAMCNCGRRPDAILNAFKEKVEQINYPNAKHNIKEKEGTPLGLPIEHYFSHPLILEDVRQLFEGTRGRIALLFNYDTAKTGEKGIIHWSGTPLEVEKKEDGTCHVTTSGRFNGLVIQKIQGKESGEDYLAVGDTSFIAIKTDNLPSQEDIAKAESEFTKLQGTYINQKHLEWGTLEFEVSKDKDGHILLGAKEGGKPNFVPQSIVKVETNSILFNGHDRQPPDKIFKFIRDSVNTVWRLQVLDYISKKFIEERPKS
ncbi:MAG: serine hydrolase [Parachlamydiaceae bacterium]|nr:serine hydrolase [Parachlamydiaceae bacterium]